jgi:hypothetical protein
MRAAGTFCEDIREETGGTVSLVGIMPDNLAVPEGTKAIPKLAVYARVVFDVDEPPVDLEMQLIDSSGEVVQIGTFTAKALAEARDEAKKRGLPIVTIVLHAIFVPFKVQPFGMTTAYIIANKQRQVCAVLSVKPITQTSASALPSAQSPSAS